MPGLGRGSEEGCQCVVTMLLIHVSLLGEMLNFIWIDLNSIMFALY